MHGETERRDAHICTCTAQTQESQVYIMSQDHGEGFVIKTFLFFENFCQLY